MANLFSTFRTVTKTDYQGTPYQTSILDDKRRDLGALWDEFKNSRRYETRGFSPMSTSQQDREILKEEIKNGSI